MSNQKLLDYTLNVGLRCAADWLAGWLADWRPRPQANIQTEGFIYLMTRLLLTLDKSGLQIHLLHWLINANLRKFHLAISRNQRHTTQRSCAWSPTSVCLRLLTNCVFNLLPWQHTTDTHTRTHVYTNVSVCSTAFYSRYLCLTNRRLLFLYNSIWANIDR